MSEPVEEKLFKKGTTEEKHKHKHEKPLDPRVLALTKEISNLSTRLRMLEERYTSLRKKTQLTDQNLIESHKKLSSNIIAANSEVNEFKNELSQLKDETGLIISQLKESATKQEVTILQRYLDLWEPMSFVTRDEVVKMIKEVKDR